MTEPNEPWSGFHLNRRSPVPLWAQLARECRLAVVEQGLPRGTPLPSESWIADRYALSRSTVHRACQVMQGGDMIAMKHGGYRLVEEVPMQYVPVLPGARITAPAGDPDEHPHIPWWLIVALRVQQPDGRELVYDATRTTLVIPD